MAKKKQKKIITKKFKKINMEAKLVTLLRTTFDELDELWRSIGLSPKERSEQVDHLYEEVQNLCKTRIATEHALADSYRNQVKKLKEDIAICADRLDMEIPVKILGDHPSLVRELTVLRGTYEEMDKKKAELEKQILEKLSPLHQCWEEMKMKFEPGFESIGFKLTAKRLNEVEHKYEQVRKEKEKKQKMFYEKVNKASELLELLEMDNSTTSNTFEHAILKAMDELDGKIVSISDFKKKDLFKEIISSHFNKDEASTELFLKFENQVWNKIMKEKDYDDFNLLNRQTLNYATNQLEPDIQIMMMKNKQERFREFFKNNKLVVSVLILPFVGPFF